MSFSEIAGLAVVIVTAVSMGIFTVVFRRRPYRGLRVLPAFNRLRRAIGLAVEDGSRLHVSLGRASLIGPQSASGLVGLSVLDRIAQMSSVSDCPPVATSGDGAFAILSQDTLHAAYRQANALDHYDPTRGMLTGPTPFSYAAGAMPVVMDENITANILVGNFGSEIGLVMDAIDRENSFSLAGSDSLPAQAIFYAAAQDPLIGEEVFASGAYLQAGPMHAASLRTQDLLRGLLIVIMIAGAILKLVGML